MTPLKPTRAELHAWLEAQGLEHLARLNLEAAAPFVDRAQWPRLREVGAKRRLTELASLEGVKRAKDWLDGETLERFSAGVRELIDAEVRNLALAKAELPRRTAPPDDERLRAVHGRLMQLRSRIPDSIAPRLETLLPRDTIELDAALPGFLFRELLPSERLLRDGGGFAPAKVRLALSEQHPSATCSCGATPACVHQLAAIDTVLLALREGLPPRTLEALTRPAWHRTLAALQKVFSAETATPAKPVERKAVSFRLHVEGEHATVSAWMGTTPVTRVTLLGNVIEPSQAPLIALLPEPGEPAPRSLLEGLVGHPRVFLENDPERQVRIERTQVGLAAEDRLGAVSLNAAIDGAPVPAMLAERLRRSKPDDALFLWDEGPCLLTLLELAPKVRAALEVLHREGGAFPKDGVVPLLESLSEWAEQVPVAMPRSVLGETLPSQRQLVLRLDARSGVDVEVDVRVRPLPDAPALRPGVGSKDVHLRRGDHAVHAVRDLAGERAAAEALIRALQLPEPSPMSEWIFCLDKPDDVFAMLERCAQHPAAPQLEWVSKPWRSLGATGPRALRVHLDEHADWFDGLGTLSVFGERVELARMVEALRRDSRFVEVRQGDFVELNESLRALLVELGAHATSGKRTLRFGPGAVEVLRSLQTAGAEIDGDAAWKRLSERAEAARKLDPRLPKNFRGELRPYQLDAYRWLMRLATLGAGGVLADDMGLGKTVQSLAVLTARAELGPALVIAPTSVAFNWADEAKRFAPDLRVLVYSDSSDRTETLDQLRKGDVLVLSYALLVRDAKALSKKHFATVVFDEAQQVKNSNTQRFHAAKAMRGDFKFALSGTPVENHLGELWTIYALVFPALLGPWDGFRERFAMPIEKRVDPRTPGELARVLSPFLLRRTKSEVERELPARTEIRVPVTLSTAEWQLYEDTRLAALSDLETPKKKLKEAQRRVQVLALLTRLRLAAAHPRLLVDDSPIPSSKLERLLELLEELRASGQRSLIFSQFTSHLALVAEALKARGVAFLSLDGSTPAAERKRLVDEFQHGDAPAFLISVKAGGFGLNLTAASNVIHLDPWWNPAVEDQASDRAHRIGQRRAVTIYRLISSGTVEEKMLTLHARKRELVDQVLSGHGKVATDELLKLFGA